MNENQGYLMVENANARWERIVKKIVIGWIITVILAIAAIVAVDYGWRAFLSDTEIEDCTISSNDGDANYIGRDGDINNGNN